MRSLKDVYATVPLGDLKVGRSVTRKDAVFDGVSRRMVSESYSLEDMNKAFLPIEDNDFGIQSQIRALFGKRGFNRNVIGGHPHFVHLEEQGARSNGYVVTLFMDIKGSTKLGLLYDAETVFFIKNQIIKCAIETVGAFDGHVHRIMGDAVLAFFRSNGESPRNSAIDAVNCGAYLVEFMRQVVRPTLEQLSLAEDVGIRIGIDYGPEEQVLWGMYGYRGASEVTATSFYVDVAAKLQQCAPKNRVMLGASIRDLLDLHEGVVEAHYVVRDGVKEKELYVAPNYTIPGEGAINYKKYVLSQKAYYDLLPKPEWEDRPIKISGTLKAGKDLISDDQYYACSRRIDKPYGIDFKAVFNLSGSFDKVLVKFRVVNNGQEALDNAGSSRDDHESFVEAIQRPSGEYFAHRWERTNYVGLHYMYVSVWVASSMLIKEQCYGVYVGPD